MNPNIRDIAAHLLLNWESGNLDLEPLMEMELRKFYLEKRDRRFLQELIYGVVRRKITLDYAIDAMLDTAELRNNKLLRQILRIGIYQSSFMDRVPNHAIVNEAVLSAKSDSDTFRTSGVVNAVLRKILATRGRLPKPPESEKLINRLVTNYSHPAWLIERWLKQFGLANTKKLLDFNNIAPTNYLRRAIKGISRPQFEADAVGVCDCSHGGSGFMNLFYPMRGSTPDEISLFRQGLCTVQAPSSGWVVAIMGILRSSKILDVSAAPGGKMSLMSELIGERGAICANDISAKRLLLCRENIQRMNLKNVFMINSDGANMPFAGEFDRVLLDAPCSGSGVMHRHPDSRWRRSNTDIDYITTVQKELIDSAASFVVPGGYLIYSTCSVDKSENSLQVDEFLKRHSEFEHVGVPDLIPQQYVDNDGYLSITPFEHGIDGMFAARLQRKQ